ncbi:hypothetical protein QQM39_09910 [Streptomyces sp. DT2A-34]|nr:hypothetical protein [Streptomyces sp. DT2A-34]MDO0911157.1 hypothetical protein [Streptomyces sp. DT2A-34]
MEVTTTAIATGSETLDRARSSVTGKLSSGTAERVLRRRGDDEEG